MIITQAEISECKLPLPRPIKLGAVEITTRDFVTLRLFEGARAVGEALAYPRAALLFETAHHMAHSIVGGEVAARRHLIESYLARQTNNREAYIKAASLFDIALWDAAAKHVEQPLHALLGGLRREVPVMAVAGYYVDERSVTSVEAEVRALVGLGFSRIKVMLRGNDAVFDGALLRKLSRLKDVDLAVDAHWAWTSRAEAARFLRQIDDLGLRFIEDPFAPHRVGQMPDLRQKLRTPVAAGEDLTSLATIFQTLGTVDYYRLDATTCGGISSAAAILGAADVMGTAVLPHVFLPLHAQLAGSFRAIEAVEYIPTESGACPMYELLRVKPQITNGSISLDTSPGAGFDLDTAALDRFTTRRVVISAEDGHP